MSDNKMTAGLDAGTECVKAVVLDETGTLQASTIVPRRGYFQDRISEAFTNVVKEAHVEREELVGVCATGFGDNCAPMATTFLGEASCHALGAFHYHPQPVWVIDIGGRDPKAIEVDDRGLPTAVHTLRRCAAGIGTFLNFAARQLDVHPSRLQEMATMAAKPAMIGSFCSTFSGQDILERLREGASREDVALGCINSIAERVLEIAEFDGDILVTGGVAEYYPGVLHTLAEKTGCHVKGVPNPILAGAVGAALWAFKVPVSNLYAKGEA